MEDLRFLKFELHLSHFGLKVAFAVGLLDHKHVLIQFNHQEDY